MSSLTSLKYELKNLKEEKMRLFSAKIIVNNFNWRGTIFDGIELRLLKGKESFSKYAEKELKEMIKDYAQIPRDIMFVDPILYLQEKFFENEIELLNKIFQDENAFDYMNWIVKKFKTEEVSLPIPNDWGSVSLEPMGGETDMYRFEGFEKKYSLAFSIDGFYDLAEAVAKDGRKFWDLYNGVDFIIRVKKEKN